MGQLVEPTAEGKVLVALADGPKTYTELKRASGLSDRWLALKLKGLSSRGAVGLRDGRYVLLRPSILSGDPFAALYMKTRGSLLGKAKLVADELSQNPEVLAVILFGSVAKGTTTRESDLDFLVITTGRELNDEAYELMFKYDVPIETLFMTFDEFLSNASERSSLLVGVLEGFQVFHDRAGVEGILSFLKEELVANFQHDEEAGAWVRTSRKPISRRQ